jgi:arginase
MGPSALRIAGIERKLKNIGYAVSDLGDIYVQTKETQDVANPRLKYLDEIVRASEILSQMVERTLKKGHFPLCIGGDHSMSIGSIAGIASYCRKNDSTLGVIWIDAHSDMNSEDTTTSGNIHGMPMAASLGLGNEKLTDLLGFAPKVSPENCALIAVRSIDNLEKKNIRSVNLPVYTMSDIDRKGAYGIIDEVLRSLKERADHIHVSFDLDGLDPSVATGVGTPVPGGLTYREAHLIMETIAERGGMGSMDVAEINPILDHRNESAEVTAEIVASVMGKRIL